MIKRIKVHNLNALKDPTYRFPGNYGVEKFLELFSGELWPVLWVDGGIQSVWNVGLWSNATIIKTLSPEKFLIEKRFPVTLCITEEDYDAFCLAYMFTYRDFEMGTLGLAWTGDLKNAGGVCEKNGVSETGVGRDVRI